MKQPAFRGGEVKKEFLERVDLRLYPFLLQDWPGKGLPSCSFNIRGVFQGPGEGGQIDKERKRGWRGKELRAPGLLAGVSVSLCRSSDRNHQPSDVSKGASQGKKLGGGRNGLVRGREKAWTWTRSHVAWPGRKRLERGAEHSTKKFKGKRRQGGRGLSRS